MDAEILFERRGAVALATLNRPEALNALTLEMIREYGKALARWRDDPTVAAVVLRGAGARAFCAGGDVRSVCRAKGAGERAVILRHALRNALLPVVTIVGLQFGALLSGAVITENVFAWPGIGTLLVQAITARDYPLVQGCVLVIALCYVAVNFLTDALYSLIDPRVRS